ncbi:MAG: S-layer homology domain-containing protein [Bacillota bacterium]|nr:S-layer homology domain-containing protein [Bacillota bacterium]
MNIKSKWICISTTALLTLTIAGNSFAVKTTFTDLTNISEKEKIIELQKNGYVNGVSSSLFAPKGAVTVAESIQLIVKVLDLNLDAVRFIKEPKATDYFKKAKNDAWYANALITASVNGLDFPSDIDLRKELSREEFTYYLVRSMELHEKLPMIKIVPPKIADEDKISVNYEGAIQRAIVYGIVKLDKDGKFNPKAKMTRAGAAEQAYNALEYLKAHKSQAQDPQQGQDAQQGQDPQ